MWPKGISHKLLGHFKLSPKLSYLCEKYSDLYETTSYYTSSWSVPGVV